MTQLSVILCETAPRWAPALRVAFARTSPQVDTHIAIRKVRSLAEVRQTVQQWPNSLLVIEIKRSSVGQALAEIPLLLPQFPQCRAVALLNRTPKSASHDSENRLVTVLHEAGFLDVALSPRRLDGVVEICRRFAEEIVSEAAKNSDNRSYCEQVRGALPWQPALPPVG